MLTKQEIEEAFRQLDALDTVLLGMMMGDFSGEYRDELYRLLCRTADERRRLRGLPVRSFQ